VATDMTQRGTPRRRRADGERSHEAILSAAAQLATIEGLDGLSIGRLADHVGMSKSGLFAHFGSKEDLQLATVDKAYEVFVADVIAPALEQPNGLGRFEALCEGFLSHVEREVFAGGCFFAAAAAELDTRPGAVRDRIAGIHRDWSQLVESGVEAAQRSGELDPAVDPDQLTFELLAMLSQANAAWVLFRDPAVFARARCGLAARIEQAKPKA
jgi:AcrR family transcriptional regulator